MSFNYFKYRWFSGKTVYATGLILYDRKLCILSITRAKTAIIITLINNSRFNSGI